MIDSASMLTLLEVGFASAVAAVAAVWFLLRATRRHANNSSAPTGATPRTDALEDIFQDAPIPAWTESKSGVVLNSNAAYDALAKPEPDQQRLFQHPPDLDLSHAKPIRYTASLAQPDVAQPTWFEITLRDVAEHRVGYAVPISNQIKAETALRDFTQTLTKTFAHLPVGLAIFDSNRELVLFNPAIGDLTNLPVEFLASRPSLFGFLDRLRETQMMPEPKDYKSWRNDMAALEAAAVDGTYSELWTLPSQLTYRVSGRPHPDGAIAFVFEDISADIKLKRRFRTEIEQAHEIFDCFDESIAIFSNVGVMTFVNESYRKLWGNDPSSALIETGIVDATRDWQSLCRPSPIWGDLRDYILNARNRSEWCDEIELLDGTHVSCRIAPLANGATLVRFIERTDTALLPILTNAEAPEKIMG